MLNLLQGPTPECCSYAKETEMGRIYECHANLDGRDSWSKGWVSTRGKSVRSFGISLLVI